ncbi:MAG TPA: DUF1499 domain-containing protein [Pseudolabrys sp.]|jgi:uncharacterized protein (DUF1499 family)|nr:DUF1499 domain-containing protein [Pseudolabrys sp.]
MWRRPFAEIPKSRLAVRAWRLALFALLATLLSIIILRLDLLEIVPAMATFAAALGCALLAFLLAFASFVPIWREGLGGLRYALGALLIAILLLTYPAYLGTRALQLPQINDITTDTSDPPRFGVLARLRPRGTDEYPGPAAAALQQQAYPDIVPLEVSASAAATFDVALKLAERRKWRVVSEQEPAPQRNGILEAVARTPIMGFRDDVVIRITAIGPNAARVDVRSASRYGSHDFGTNAARVRKLLDDIDDAVASLPERKREPKMPQPTKRPAPSAKR